MPAPAERTRDEGDRLDPGDISNSLEAFCDLLGHDLVGIALQSELAAALVPDSPGQAVRAMHDVAEIARRGLRGLRGATETSDRATARRCGPGGD